MNCKLWDNLVGEENILLYQRICTIKPKGMLAHEGHECSVNKVWTEGEGVVARQNRKKSFFCRCRLAGCIIIYCPTPLASQRILPGRKSLLSGVKSMKRSFKGL